MMKYFMLIGLISLCRSGIEGVYKKEILNACRDGEDQTWELTLSQDFSFRYSYRMKHPMKLKEDTFKMKGFWNVRKDTLTLKSFDHPFVVNFILKEDSLLLLKDNGYIFRDAFDFSALGKEKY